MCYRGICNSLFQDPQALLKAVGDATASPATDVAAPVPPPAAPAAAGAIKSPRGLMLR